jgi:hypothetical protein
MPSKVKGKKKKKNKHVDNKMEFLKNAIRKGFLKKIICGDDGNEEFVRHRKELKDEKERLKIISDNNNSNNGDVFNSLMWNELFIQRMNQGETLHTIIYDYKSGEKTIINRGGPETITEYQKSILKEDKEFQKWMEKKKEIELAKACIFENSLKKKKSSKKIVKGKKSNDSVVFMGTLKENSETLNTIIFADDLDDNIEEETNELCKQEVLIKDEVKKEGIKLKDEIIINEDKEELIEEENVLVIDEMVDNEDESSESSEDEVFKSNDDKVKILEKKKKRKIESSEKKKEISVKAILQSDKSNKQKNNVKIIKNTDEDQHIYQNEEIPDIFGENIDESTTTDTTYITQLTYNNNGTYPTTAVPINVTLNMGDNTESSESFTLNLPNKKESVAIKEDNIVIKENVIMPISDNIDNSLPTIDIINSTINDPQTDSIAASNFTFPNFCFSSLDIIVNKLIDTNKAVDCLDEVHDLFTGISENLDDSKIYQIAMKRVNRGCLKYIFESNESPKQKFSVFWKNTVKTNNLQLKFLEEELIEKKKKSAFLLQQIETDKLEREKLLENEILEKERIEEESDIFENLTVPPYSPKRRDEDSIGSSDIMDYEAEFDHIIKDSNKDLLGLEDCSAYSSTITEIKVNSPPISPLPSHNKFKDIHVTMPKLPVKKYSVEKNDLIEAQEIYLLETSSRKQTPFYNEGGSRRQTPVDIPSRMKTPFSIETPRLQTANFPPEESSRKTTPFLPEENNRITTPFSRDRPSRKQTPLLAEANNRIKTPITNSIMESFHTEISFVPKSAAEIALTFSEENSEILTTFIENNKKISSKSVTPLSIIAKTPTSGIPQILAEPIRSPSTPESFFELTQLKYNQTFQSYDSSSPEVLDFETDESMKLPSGGKSVDYFSEDFQENSNIELLDSRTKSKSNSQVINIPRTFIIDENVSVTKEISSFEIGDDNEPVKERIDYTIKNVNNYIMKEFVLDLPFPETIEIEDTNNDTMIEKKACTIENDNNCIMKEFVLDLPCPETIEIEDTNNDAKNENNNYFFKKIIKEINKAAKIEFIIENKRNIYETNKESNQETNFIYDSSYNNDKEKKIAFERKSLTVKKKKYSGIKKYKKILRQPFPINSRGQELDEVLFDPESLSLHMFSVRQGFIVKHQTVNISTVYVTDSEIPKMVTIRSGEVVGGYIGTIKTSDWKVMIGDITDGIEKQCKKKYEKNEKRELYNVNEINPKFNSNNINCYSTKWNSNRSGIFESQNFLNNSSLSGLKSKILNQTGSNSLVQKMVDSNINNDYNENENYELENEIIPQISYPKEFNTLYHNLSQQNDEQIAESESDDDDEAVYNEDRNDINDYDNDVSIDGNNINGESLQDNLLLKTVKFHIEEKSDVNNGLQGYGDTTWSFPDFNNFDNKKPLVKSEEYCERVSKQTPDEATMHEAIEAASQSFEQILKKTINVPVSSSSMEFSRPGSIKQAINKIKEKNFHKFKNNQNDKIDQDLVKQVPYSIRHYPLPKDEENNIKLPSAPSCPNTSENNKSPSKHRKFVAMTYPIPGQNDDSVFDDNDNNNGNNRSIELPTDEDNLFTNSLFSL